MEETAQAFLGLSTFTIIQANCKLGSTSKAKKKVCTTAFGLGPALGKGSQNQWCSPTAVSNQ
jgi:hypothetical protein